MYLSAQKALNTVYAFSETNWKCLGNIEELWRKMSRVFAVCGAIVVFLSVAITTITAFSATAVCTRCAKGEEIHSVISRFLGLELRRPFCVCFSVSNAVGTALCAVGFAEHLRDLFKEFEIVVYDGSSNDVRIIGLALRLVSFATAILIALISLPLESKMQLCLLAIQTLSLLNYFVGTFMPVSSEVALRGVTGYSATTIAENLQPAFTSGENFFTVFAVFFPAVIGFLAGSTGSDDLKDPQTAIPKGTALSIALTTVVYLSVLFSSGATCVRDADGIYSVVRDPTYAASRCSRNLTCQYGLRNNYHVMELQSVWSSVVTAGVFACTLSAALSCLASGHKISPAKGQDLFFPKEVVFDKAHGRSGAFGYDSALGLGIAVTTILIGKVNIVAPLITNCFLAVYALINYICFNASFTGASGAVLCIILMFFISWITALVIMFTFGLVFVYVLHAKPRIKLESSHEAQTYKKALKAAYELTNTEENVHNYRPQFLVLTGHPAVRPQLIDFVHNISKDSTLVLCGCVLPLKPCDAASSAIRRLEVQINEWLRRRHIKSFCVCVANPDIRFGAQTFLQVYGLGKLRPNVLFLGFKSRWSVRGIEGLKSINDYFGTIQDAFLNQLGVCILRNSGGYDDFELSEKCSLSNTVPYETSKEVQSAALTTKSVRSKSARNGGKCDNSMHSVVRQKPILRLNAENEAEDTRLLRHNKLQQAEEALIRSEVRAFRQKVIAGSKQLRSDYLFHPQKLPSHFGSLRQYNCPLIDVWWLYDDGGLELLLPYLLTKAKSCFENARLRFFAISKAGGGTEHARRRMTALLDKFRVVYSDLVVISSIGEKPKEQIQREFEELIAPFREQKDNAQPGLITEAELVSQAPRTNQHLRCAELLRELSKSSSLIILSLPVPHKRPVSSCLYMAWLEILTRGFPLTLLVGGNQTSALTFFS